jgi:hypothetical protein|tara:strand:+ start:202 stop:378 length:177 start_codon:yes stop_codon:yes gene_type:complete
LSPFLSQGIGEDLEAKKAARAARFGIPIVPPKPTVPVKVFVQHTIHRTRARPHAAAFT